LPKSIDETYAEYCFLIEKELGCKIHPHYPAVRFIEQIKQIDKYYKEVNKQQNRSMRKSTFRG